MKKWSWKFSAQKMLIGSAEEKLLSPHSLPYLVMMEQNHENYDNTVILVRATKISNRSKKWKQCDYAYTGQANWGDI